MSYRVTSKDCDFDTNPLSDIIDDQTFKTLVDEKVLHATGIRDFLIRKLFKELRGQGMRVDDAVDEIQRRYYPELQWDTVRKICYGMLR